jgi:ADP-L-glycero-D-manno-heptose 6-epimerase
MYIVTGGAGFIGSNLVMGLNARGETDILVVDDLTDGRKALNLAQADIADYRDKLDFLAQITGNRLPCSGIRAVFHQGACSSTTEWNGKKMMDDNYHFSQTLFHWCQAQGIPFIYASSASVYGMGPVFREERAFERPLNVYAYSKFLLDTYIRQQADTQRAPVVGLRYFNVYGPREQHKDSMASVAWHFYKQLQETGRLRLFEGSDGYGPGEQRRDFIHVDDVVAGNLWFLDHPEVSGVYNLGTGKAQSFNDVAHAVLRWYGQGQIDYIPFPDPLKGRYQSFTEADMSALRACGFAHRFLPVEEGVPRYLDWLKAQRL